MPTLANIARMTTTTTGTGSITLVGAASGYITFANAGITDGQIVSYGIVDGTAREVGRGVYTHSTLNLTRNVLKSTNSNSAIFLSGAAEVYVTSLVEDISYIAGGAGAMIYRSSNVAANTSGPTPVDFNAVIYNDSLQPHDSGGLQRFWLGTSKTMTVLSTVDDTLTISSHGLTTGEGPILFTNSGGALPAGITAGVKYWAIVVDANTISLATSRANALSSTKVDITGSGTGTHTLATGSKLVVPKGVSRVQCQGGFQDTASNVTVNCFIWKDGGTSYAGAARQDGPGAGTGGSTMVSPILSVSEGEYFEYAPHASSATNLVSDFTWFSILAIR